LDEAVKLLRADPDRAAMIRDVYWDDDPREAAERFFQSAEFREAARLTAERLAGGLVLDVGAGTGIAAYAFARQGARLVQALEPDPSDLVGRGAIEKLRGGLPIEIVDGFAERIPLPDATADVVFARQTLHHTRDLPLALRECARVLKPGGLFLACREHVADNPRQLQIFLKRHPIHQLVGGEHAFQLPQYLEAIEQSGLHLIQAFGPWDSLINAYPSARTPAELADLPRTLLTRKLGPRGRWLGTLPGVGPLVRAALKFPRPGRLYTFLATKP
jgi:ubiquinone/menaquinone biosynthesis C-methylase UbiE